MELKQIFIHHVFFWLKNPENPEDKALLLEGLRKLSAVKTIQRFHMGVPADTHRGVIERSYSISWLLVFDSLADEESYQVDPIHLQFVDTCAYLWNKVVVFDTVDLG